MLYGVLSLVGCPLSCALLDSQRETTASSKLSSSCEFILLIEGLHLILGNLCFVGDCGPSVVGHSSDFEFRREWMSQDSQLD